MGCSSWLSSLFYSLSVKKHFRSYLLGEYWFVFVGVVGGVGGPLVCLMRCPGWHSVKFWFVALAFTIRRTTSALPVPAAFSLRSSAQCWHRRQLSCPNSPHRPPSLAEGKPEEIPVTKSCKPSGTEVHFDRTRSSAACRCPETWFNCSSPASLWAELARAPCAGMNAVGVEHSSSFWHSRRCWVPDFYVIECLQSCAVACWHLGWFLARIEGGWLGC